MTKLTDAQRRNRWCTIQLRRAEDLTPYDIIRWPRSSWTEILGVYRDLDEWAAEFRLISSFPDGEDPGYLDQRKAAESALDADDLVVIRVIDRERSEPGCTEDTLLVRYRYELIETQDLPAWEPAPASPEEHAHA